MRIAFWHNLPSGGGKRALYDHVKGLVERGHHVEVWCPSTADINFLPLNNICREHVIPIDFQNAIKRRGILDLSYEYRLKLHQLAIMDSHCQQCAIEINETGFDILISHPCQFFATSSIGSLVHIPKILYLQEPKRFLYEAMYVNPPRLPWQAFIRRDYPGTFLFFLRRWILDQFYTQGLRRQVLIERKNAMAYDLILANSFFSRESILRAYGLESKVCYLGVDNDLYRNLHLKRESFLVGIGSFTYSKNIEFIIKSIALLPDPKPKLVWIGNIGSKKYIGELCKLAIENHVDFKPLLRISDEEIVQILNTARAMVYAPHLEPFGYAPMEANACGLPVIAVAEGGVRETVVSNNNGILVESSNVSMANAIQFMINQPELAEKMGRQGELLVKEQWTTEKSIERLMKYIENTIKSEA